MAGEIIPCIFEGMRPDNIRNKKILIAPLNWGMGHVSRCIGIVHQLLNQGNRVVIACDNEQRVIFEEYFEALEYVLHEGYPFRFGGNGRFGWDLLRNWSELKARLRKERNQTTTWVQELSIDIVLSDHRYGFYSKSVPSIFITHQYNLPVSGLQSIVDRWHKKRMRPFRYIWILDDENSRLAGKLSTTSTESRALHIGPYSRFSVYEDDAEKSYPKAVIVSGPLIYAQQLADQMSEEHPDAMFVCSEDIILPEHVARVSGSWRERDSAIREAQHIISRSGYSTIMDLDFLQVSATFYPTPGQSEQIYLNEWLTDYSEYTPSTHHGRS